MKPPRITDEQIADVLMTSRALVSDGEFARRFGVGSQRIWAIRARASKRVIAIADKLGLTKKRARACWAPDGPRVVSPPAYAVASKAAVYGRAGTSTLRRRPA